MHISHIMTFALDVLSAWNASLSDLSFHGSFCSTVSLPYHSQKSSHAPPPADPHYYLLSLLILLLYRMLSTTQLFVAGVFMPLFSISFKEM